MHPFESVSVPTLLGLTIAALTSWYLITAIAAWHRLRHIPGPFLASFSYHWLAGVARSGKQYSVYRDLCKAHGAHLVRVGPNELTTDDPEVLRRIAAARSAYGRDPWYLGGRFNPHGDSIFNLLDTAAHTERKAKIVGGFAGREAPLLEAGIDAQVRALIEAVRKNYLSTTSTMVTDQQQQGHQVDFALILSYFTLDVISKVAFGEEMGFLRTNSDLYGMLREVREFMPQLTMAVDVPWVRGALFSPWFLKWFGASETDKQGIGKCMGIARDVVARRFGVDSKDKRDLLGYWVRNGLTQRECEIDSLFLIVAGSDTTAATLRVTMLYLMTCPHVYGKLKAEIQQAVQGAKVSYPVSFEEAKRLPYLQAVVYEGLRQRPPAPGLYPKRVPREGDVIHGHFIPGGTGIGMNTASLFCSTTHFGVDADVFRPERFTEASEPARVEMEKLVELGFGYGRFMCAGKPVAFMELYKGIFELMRTFDFQLVNPTKPWESRSYSVFIERDMFVKVTESSTDSVGGT